MQTGQDTSGSASPAGQDRGEGKNQGGAYDLDRGTVAPCRHVVGMAIKNGDQK